MDLRESRASSNRKTVSLINMFMNRTKSASSLDILNKKKREKKKTIFNQCYLSKCFTGLCL